MVNLSTSTSRDAMGKWFSEKQDCTLFIDVWWDDESYMVVVQYQNLYYKKAFASKNVVGKNSASYDIRKEDEVRSFVIEQIVWNSINRWDVSRSIYDVIHREMDKFKGWLIIRSIPEKLEEIKQAKIYCGENVSRADGMFTTPVLGVWLQNCKPKNIEDISKDMGTAICGVWATGDGRYWHSPKNGLWVVNDSKCAPSTNEICDIWATGDGRLWYSPNLGLWTQDCGVNFNQPLVFGTWSTEDGRLWYGENGGLWSTEDQSNSI